MAGPVHPGPAVPGAVVARAPDDEAAVALDLAAPGQFGRAEDAVAEEGVGVEIEHAVISR